MNNVFHPTFSQQNLYIFWKGWMAWALMQLMLSHSKIDSHRLQHVKWMVYGWSKTLFTCNVQRTKTTWTQTKVSRSFIMLTYNHTPHKYLSGVWSCVDLRMDTKRHVFKRYWTTCSKYIPQSRFNSEPNCQYLYDHLIRTRIFWWCM